MEIICTVGIVPCVQEINPNFLSCLLDHSDFFVGYRWTKVVVTDMSKTRFPNEQARFRACSVYMLVQLFKILELMGGSVRERISLCAREEGLFLFRVN
jgi:hypothetical protein